MAEEVGVVGSYYRAFGVRSTAPLEEIRAGAQRFAATARPAECPPLADALADEGLRQLSDPAMRAAYDRHLAAHPTNPWPSPWPFRVSLGEPGLVPFTTQRFCDRCFAYPARDATIPHIRFSAYGPAIRLDPSAPRRGVSPLTVRRCRTCGLREIRRAIVRNVPQLVIIVAVLVIGFLTHLVPIVLLGAVFGVAFAIFITSAVLRFGLQRAPSSVLASSKVMRD